MTSTDKIPTIVRMAFRVAPERVDAFETRYKEKLAPILKRHGLVEIPPRSPFWKRGNVMLRPAIEGVFVQRFELNGPAQLVKKQEALQSDPAYQEALRDLTAQFGGGSESALNRLTFESAPAGPGKTTPAGSGRGHFRTYDGVDGLVNNWVWSIFQDREGHLWFATDGGVSRYDGQSWRNWNTKDGLIHDQVFQVLQDREGVFWFGTSGGVSRYDGQVWRNWNTKDGLIHDQVFQVLQDREGVFWFGTSGGMSRYDGQVWRNLTTKDGLADGWVTCMLEDREGALWFGTGRFDAKGGGVSRYDGKVWKTFTTEHGLASNTVIAIFQDRDGAMWFGTTGGLGIPGRGVSRYDGKTWTTFTTEHGLASNTVSAIFQDREGTLWFSSGTSGGGGVSRYDGQVFTSFTTADGLASTYVSSILQDREGHLWFGTIVGGASRYDGQIFTSFTTAGGLASDIVSSILQDQEGHLWFGTMGGGVCRYDGKTWRTFTTEDGLAGNMVRSVFQDQAGNLWFGTNGSGVSRYDGQRVTTFSVPDGVHQSMFSMIQDRNGCLWVGTYGRGVSRYDGKEWTTFTTADGLADDDVRSVFEDREGVLWFGTFGGGVSRYRDGQFETITEKDGLANNTVWSIFQDQEGHLWFGTIGGLSRYDGKAWTTLTREDGLTHEVVYAIYQDREGVLWFGTGGGISRYDGSVFQTLTHQDGLVGNQVYAIFQDTEGALWFGTSNGVTRYCKPHASPPPVFVDAITADRRYEDVSEIAISSTVGLIGFEFHGMSLKTRPEAMVYRYRLKGYEEEWHTTRARRVEYENLPLGDYTFEVVAVDRDLVYSEVPATVRLHVVRDARDEQIDELERRVRERTRKLEEANRELVVEAALERVRVAALAMKASTDLAQTGTVVFQQLKELGVPAWRGGFAIIRETSSRPVYELWGLTGEGIIIRGVEVPVNTHPLFERVYAAWKRGDDYCQEEIAGDPLKEYIRALQRTGYPAQLPAGWTTFHIGTLLFTDGGLYAVTQNCLSDEEVAVLRRFRDVFSFAYTRFLDLQKAEAQAKASARQAAADRVRAEIATMRTSTDLEEVTPLIWKELTGLGVSFVRCGVFILNEETQRARLYLTNPRGASLAALELPFDCHPYICSIVDHWREKKVYTDRWDRRMFQDWMAFLQNQGYAVQPDRYQDGETPPEMLVLQCVPFVHGMLYVGSAEPLTDEDLTLLQMLANAFSVAYARYLDFQKLEAQNQALDIANREIQTQTERKSAFLASMSHELRTPMNAIKGFTNLVRRREQTLSDRGRENLEKVGQASDHLMALINDLLDLSKIEAGRMDVNPVAFRVQHLITYCVSTVRPLVQDGVALLYECDGTGEAHTDEARVRQMVINLLSNAIKFTNAGEVKVTARIDDGQSTIDDGKGEGAVSGKRKAESGKRKAASGKRERRGRRRITDAGHRGERHGQRHSGRGTGHDLRRISTGQRQ